MRLLLKKSGRSLILLNMLAILSLKDITCQNLNNAGFNLPDSLSLLFNNCITDTCRFKILYDYYWTFADYDHGRVREAGEQAFSIIKNSDNLKLLADGLDIKGVILEKDKEYDSAYLYFLSALDISSSINYESRTRWSLYHLGLIQKIRGNADSSLYYLRETQKHGFPDNESPSQADILKQIAFVFYDLYMSRDSAESYLNQALISSRESGDNAKKAEAYISLMTFYYKTNQVRKLLETINLALVHAEENNFEKVIINIYDMIGDMFLVQKRNYETAMDYYKKVLEICRPEYKQWEATILNDIGDLYLQMGNDSLALVYINEGHGIARELNYKHQLSESYRNLGKVYKYQGRLQDAIDSYQLCYDTGCDKCSKVVFHNALIDIGDAYMTLNDYDKAFEYYNESLALAEQFNAVKEAAISNLRLGNYFSRNSPVNARLFYETSARLAEQSNDLRVVKDIADTLSFFYRENRDYKKAFEYQLLARTAEDSLINEENEASLSDWELKSEIEKINRENLLQEQLAAAEISRQKAYRNVAFLITLLLIIPGSVIYLGYRRKKKDNLLLEKMSEELHHSDEAKLRFFASVSHELRTPLTLILNPAKNLLESVPVKGEQKRQLEYIYNNAIRLRDLTDQIMDLQKLDAGKLVLNPEEADIIGYCVGIASSFESLCFKKNNSLLIHSNCSSAITKFDKDKIGKILSNLLSNAFKFCFEGSSIELHMDLRDNIFMMSVCDHGIGIPAGELDKAFKQYYRASTNNQIEGSGIGLSYVKELTAFMNGKAEIESAVQKGTKVNISLPVNIYTIIDDSPYELIIPKGKKFRSLEYVFPEDTDESKNMILIVEDNDELRTFIGDLLKRQYNLVMAVNGRNGAEMAFKHMPDLIISDVMMPDINGFEMCSVLKKDERTSHIPVILLTAKDGVQSNIEGYLTGADDYIIKPFDNELLRLKIRNVVATAEASRKQFDIKTILNVDSFKFSQTDKEFMRKCMSVIERHIDDSSFSVEVLAVEMSFSSRNFYRKIKALTNQTPADLIRVYRLHYAKKLLQNTGMKVFEIAMAVGYEDVNRFRQAFKKHFGFPPSESINNVIV